MDAKREEVCVEPILEFQRMVDWPRCFGTCFEASYHRGSLFIIRWLGNKRGAVEGSRVQGPYL